MDYYEGKLNHLWVDLFILDKLPEGKAAASLTRLIHIGYLRPGYGAPP